MARVWKGAETFLIQRGTAGCLLLHGGTGTPAVMKPMGDFLAYHGVSVLGKRLKGFGSSTNDWLKTSHQDWIASAEEGFNELKKNCESIFVSGLSMGGSLALYLASQYREEVKGVIPICAPAGPKFLESFRNKFTPLALENAPQVNYSAGDIKDPNVQAGGYDCHYPSLNLEWAKIVEKCNSGLKAVECPVLIVQASNDHVIDPKTAEWIHENIRSDKKEIFWLPNSYHMATIDVDRQLVFEKAAEFIRVRAQD